MRGMMQLSEQVRQLERKAERFDDAVDRIMNLKLWIDSFENGEATPQAVINQVKNLVDFYESSSRAWIAKVENQGYQQGKLEKYFDSKFNGEEILEVKATEDGEVFAITQSGEHFVERMSDDCDFKQGLDCILCDIQHVDGLELIK
tara:strand:- start:178 stop:615 length:438 start_codon:yes stop_codon:yes gene_type:complete